MAMSDQNKRRAAAAAIATSIAIPAEGIRQFAYYDPPGILTVCYGHTGSDVEKGRRYTLPECDKFLNDDMRKAVAQVDACQPGLPENVLAAFADAAYNLGPTVACNVHESHAARYLRAGRVVEACNELPKWNKTTIAGVKVPLPGLTSRRAKERGVCLGGDHA
jgi:GH24 family phage-related lysozyme (muramidase)